ncbi:MAG: hypothetical protein D6703_06680 [Zetaproteobacteria bacterium]|nr:MAG: hypothetical protein D6703_06680 [Zetaproteobacteria bacterium]
MMKQWVAVCSWAVLLLISGCVHAPHKQVTGGIGPYSSVHGRLAVIMPGKRWQVMLDWFAERPERGSLRLVHGASGRIIEVRWEQPKVYLRDSSAPHWQTVGLAELERQGILLPPWELASILLGHMPDDFHAQAHLQWDARRKGALLRIQWEPERGRLSLTDITHGRSIILFLQDAS